MESQNQFDVQRPARARRGEGSGGFVSRNGGAQTAIGACRRSASRKGAKTQSDARANGAFAASRLCVTSTTGVIGYALTIFASQNHFAKFRGGFAASALA